ncbi:MAG: cyanophycinase [Bacteroidales bacterium]
MKFKLFFLFFLYFIAFNFALGQNKAGTLFIIGGGEKTDELMKDLIATSGISEKDYVLILPMASEEPDSSIIWAKEDFISAGIKNVVGFNFKENEPVSPSRLDSLKKARLIFISGGDQTRFMKAIGKGPVYTAIHEAFKNGSTISGTSAGAAVMSKKMLTGNSLKYPEYTGKYPTIEANNIEITEGLGLLTGVIVDQHFVKRQRLNRLIAASIENPDETCIGIDESTAIVVKGNSFRVSGSNQVIVLKNTKKVKNVKSGLLGTKGLILDILLPGETYSLK